MIYRPNDIVRFRTAPGNEYLTIIDCNGCVATCRHGDEVIHVAVGDIFHSPVDAYLCATKGD